MSSLTVTLEEEQYYCKAISDEIIKINVSTPDSYRRLIKHFKADNVVHQTYQPREERAYRLVLRHLQHSIHPDVIKSELVGLGYIAHNVFNICHLLTKAPSLYILWILNRATIKRTFLNSISYVT